MAAVAAGVALALSSGAASAIVYTINDPNNDLSGYPAPYATASVILNTSTSATVTFQSQTTGGYLYLMGDGGTADVNVHATSFSVSGITATNSIAGFNAPSCPASGCNGGSGTVDGFGVFNQTINLFDGFTSAATTVSFTLTNTGGTWGSDADVLTANASGHLAAMHAFVCQTPCTTTNGALVTGFAADGAGTLPEPGALGLTGMVLAVLGVTTRRRRRK
jgi:hypothetical protein